MISHNLHLLPTDVKGNYNKETLALALEPGNADEEYAVFQKI